MCQMADPRFTASNELSRPAELVVLEFHPKLGGLMNDLEQELIVVDQLIGMLLTGEKVGNFEILLVVGLAFSFENGLRLTHRTSSIPPRISVIICPHLSRGNGNCR